MKRIFLSIILAGTVLFTACKKDNEKTELETEKTEPVGEVKTVTNLNVTETNATSFVYFSFDKNKEVIVKDPETNNEWDIAFNQYDVKTRGTLKTEQKVFEEVKEAPATGYVPDIQRTTFVERSVDQNVSSPVLSLGYSDGFWRFIESKGIVAKIPEAIRETVKTKLIHDNGPFTFGYGAGVPVFTPNNWVYVVKTATGKYAKIQVTSYTNDKNAPYYISFKYQVSNKEGKF
ncbi:HmuY family protein [Capnocytophaga canis]|uniref:HmuY family protein n=1 Tax=Capnocytophaga canis TaxID=1848903 RepID=UPI00370D9D2C